MRLRATWRKLLVGDLSERTQNQVWGLSFVLAGYPSSQKQDFSTCANCRGTSGGHKLLPYVPLIDEVIVLGGLLAVGACCRAPVMPDQILVAQTVQYRARVACGGAK